MPTKKTTMDVSINRHKSDNIGGNGTVTKSSDVLLIEKRFDVADYWMRMDFGDKEGHNSANNSEKLDTFWNEERLQTVPLAVEALTCREAEKKKPENKCEDDEDDMDEPESSERLTSIKSTRKRNSDHTDKPPAKTPRRYDFGNGYACSKLPEPIETKVTHSENGLRVTVDSKRKESNLSKYNLSDWLRDNTETETDSIVSVGPASSTDIPNVEDTVAIELWTTPHKTSVQYKYLTANQTTYGMEPVSKRFEDVAEPMPTKTFTDVTINRHKSDHIGGNGTVTKTSNVKLIEKRSAVADHWMRMDFGGKERDNSGKLDVFWSKERLQTVQPAVEALTGRGAEKKDTKDKCEDGQDDMKLPGTSDRLTSTSSTRKRELGDHADKRPAKTHKKYDFGNADVGKESPKNLQFLPNQQAEEPVRYGSFELPAVHTEYQRRQLAIPHAPSPIDVIVLSDYSDDVQEIPPPQPSVSIKKKLRRNQPVIVPPRRLPTISNHQGRTLVPIAPRLGPFQPHQSQMIMHQYQRPTPRKAQQRRSNAIPRRENVLPLLPEPIRPAEPVYLKEYRIKPKLCLPPYKPPNYYEWTNQDVVNWAQLALDLPATHPLLKTIEMKQLRGYSINRLTTDDSPVLQELGLKVGPTLRLKAAAIRVVNNFKEIEYTHNMAVYNEKLRIYEMQQKHASRKRALPKSKKIELLKKKDSF
ncbi:hypothetical protein CRE_29116 [Caenorhabditis remanei]|uniref:SAM domain-containing protein n=1 Tax=Caenorhabditis remanei TaxID=31234 RepID=E3N4M1_CAERE|nr:hypothetical protein CRE_29116 [Caenorhabditis remanei]